MAEQTSTGLAMCTEENARIRELEAELDASRRRYESLAVGRDAESDANERLRAEVEHLHRRIKNMAADVNERLDWIVRDKGEPDKVLANVSTARSVLIRYVLLSPASDENQDGGEHRCSTP